MRQRYLSAMFGMNAGMWLAYAITLEQYAWVHWILFGLFSICTIWLIIEE